MRFKTCGATKTDSELESERVRKVLVLVKIVNTNLDFKSVSYFEVSSMSLKFGRSKPSWEIASADEVVSMEWAFAASVESLAMDLFSGTENLK